MKTLLFFLAHPAHYHLFKNLIYHIKNDYKIKVIIVKKDVLEDLVKKEDWDYLNIIPEGRRYEKLPILISTILGMFKTEYRMSKFLWKNKVDLLIGTEGTLSHLGFLFRIQSLIVNEDDTSVTPENYLVYPLATKVLLPSVVDKEMWKKKRIDYLGYHELAYLHPDYFKPDIEIVKKGNPTLERYFIIRLALLTASHDIGKKGISEDILTELIEYLSTNGKVFITSEKPISEKFEKYRIPVSVHEIHHFLYFADLYIGDSQTMAMESALLGTPTIRFNSFANQCSVILELENDYQLIHSFLPDRFDDMFSKVKSIVEDIHSKKSYHEKSKIVIKQKDDLNKILEKEIREMLIL